MAKRRRNTIYGNDLYCEITPLNGGQPLKMAYRDLWIVVILLNEFDGDWNRMLDHFRAERKSPYHSDEAAGLLNHIRVLHQTLTEAGLTAEDVLTKADPELLKKQKRKAKCKILEMGFQRGDKSPWMIHTPRKHREERAMRGYWGHFPISPGEYAGRLESQYKPSGWYTEDQSFDLEDKLSRFLEKHESGASLPQLFALYRAFLTVVIEKMDGVDDSYGVISTLYGEVFDGYIQLDWRELDMPPSVFFQDLIELIIWEDYAFTWKRERALLASLVPAQVLLVESILQEQWEELVKLELEYQAEKVLTLLGMLYTEQQMFDRFTSMAEEMGTRAWERITTMSEMAEKHGRYDLALAVYEACLGPGMHKEFLRKKYEELQSRLGSA